MRMESFRKALGRRLRFVIAAAALFLLLAPASRDAAGSSCASEAFWITDPVLPAGVGGGGAGADCLFHSYAWKSFLYLMSRDGQAGNALKYERYRLAGRESCPRASCSAFTGVERADSGNGLFIRSTKQQAPAAGGRLFSAKAPGSGNPHGVSICGMSKDPTQQADGKHLYDQKGKAVLYEIRFSQSMCSMLNGSGPLHPFPENTIEMKLSWRQISTAERSRYYWRTQKTASGAELLLGLVGVHIARIESWHKELIWSTFEHRDNVPDCVRPRREKGWSFTSEPCAACLRESTAGECEAKGKCHRLNTGFISRGELTLDGVKPADICRLAPHGGGSADNIRAIRDLNESVRNRLDRLPNGNAMAVWKNYFLVGTVWLPHRFESKGPSPRRPAGSRALANATMESFQQARKNGCFSCHARRAKSGPEGISHILPHPKGNRF
ncbi:MAG: hypothetical protein Kow0032_04150 [Methyloligellaceae bacterium]